MERTACPNNNNGTGLATTVPLLLFGHAVRSIRLTTLGILQFIGPTLQFLIGWQLYGEPMSGPRLLSFSLIWLAVGIYAADAWLTRDQRPETRDQRLRIED